MTTINGLFEDLSFLIGIVYFLFLVRYRSKFNVRYETLVAVCSFSLALSLATGTLERNGMNLGYTGFLFSGLAFGWTGGIAAGFGLGIALYLLHGPSGFFYTALLPFAGFMTGFVSKRGKNFSTLLMAALLGSTLVLAGSAGYLVVSDYTLQEIPELLKPLTVSLTTGVLLGTSLAFYMRKWEKWPEIIERKP